MSGQSVHVTLYSDAAYYGGAEVYLTMLARYLDPKRFRLSAVLPDDPPVVRLEAELSAAGAEILRHLRPGMRWWEAVPQLRRIFSRLGGDVLHINLPSTYDGCLSSVALAAKLAGYRRVVTTEHLPMIDRKYKRFPVKLLFSEAVDRIIVPSFATREYVVRLHHMPYEKTTVLPYGIEEPPPVTTEIEAEIRARTDTPHGMLTLGIVGRLHPRKGHRHLFDALSRLASRRELPELRLWVIGEGEDRDALARYVEEKALGGMVRFVGPRGDAASLMRLLDLLVVPSLMETTPFVILEAMAAGRPIVASRIYGIPEMIEDGQSGYLVDPESSSQLADALLPLLRDPDRRRRFGSRGRQRYEEIFSAERMARKTEEIYDGDGRGGGR